MITFLEGIPAYLVSVMIKTEDRGRQTVLEDRVRDSCPCPLWVNSYLLSVICHLNFIWNLDFVIWTFHS